MVATIPASAVLKNRPWRAGISGTIWNGEVGITGGGVAEWRWAPLRSLTGLGYAADWKLRGPDTELGGRAIAGFSSVVLDKVSGSVDVGLLSVLRPNLPFTCAMTAQVEMDRVEMGGSGQMMQGRVLSDPGSCGMRGLPARANMPSLLFTAEKVGSITRIRLAPATQRMKTLISGTLSEGGQVELTMTPDGAQLLPFLPIPPNQPFRTTM
ncbi:hypothetical protein P1X14_20885 [Sphingomonas sp. AOB5]|uniref:hypothetical protein n=1 Tax=Sphingomonas sp. AOB5 TaxID=3034017 RepID=UPI0023F73349|nr:hypothetical protein [Sphingomonas sp. AOB5]MDF7777724.1 hypothetical protein [Sphingomonas sp. AOB5]